MMRSSALIAGNRQSLEVMKHRKTFALLALLFAPLWYTSMLFKLKDDFSPGKDKFWIYWVSGICAITLTLLSAKLIDFVLFLSK
jgi:hypothetical protein